MLAVCIVLNIQPFTFECINKHRLYLTRRGFVLDIDHGSVEGITECFVLVSVLFQPLADTLRLAHIQ